MEFIPPIFRANHSDERLDEEKAEGLLSTNDSGDEFYIEHYVDTSGLTESGHVEYDGYTLIVLIDEFSLEISFDGGETWKNYAELQKQFMQ